MFCIRCGGIIEEGQQFCINCGQPVEGFGAPAPGAQQASFGQSTGFDQTPGFDQPSAYNQPSAYAQDAAQFQPQSASYVEVVSDFEDDGTTYKKRGNKGIRILVTILVLVAIAAVIAAAVKFLYLDKQAAAGEQEFYGSETTVSISGDTVVIPYGDDDEPLESYEVTIYPDETNTGVSWPSASISVKDENGFALGGSSEMIDGLYDVEIYDADDGITYYCPTIEFASDSKRERVLLKIDPDNPQSATEPPETVYDFESVPSEVEFVYRDSESDVSVDEMWTYVQFTCSEDIEGVDTVNTKLEEAFEEEYEKAKDWQSGYSSEPQCFLVRQSVTWMSGSVACVRTQRDYTDWEGKRNRQVSGCVYDLSSGNEAGLEEAVNITTADMEDKAIEVIESYARRKGCTSSEAASVAKAAADDHTRYYIAEEGLVVCVWDEDFPSASDDDSLVDRAAEIVVVGFSGDESDSGTDVSSAYAESGEVGASGEADTAGDGD